MLDKASLAFILSVETPPHVPSARFFASSPVRMGSLTPSFRRCEPNDAVPASKTRLVRLPASTESRGPKRVAKSSKYCAVEGCTSRAKHARRCWKHGGSVKCRVADCANRAKSKGVCWSHGGGSRCSARGCDTIAVSHGFCWAHGGGKRCREDGCARPAYERTNNLCVLHFQQQQQQQSRQQRGVRSLGDC